MAKKILFQGDSITWNGRKDTEPYTLGAGYAAMVAGVLAVDYPDEYEFVNRGNCGNKIVDLYARIKKDFINLKPDYASIYVGFNDVCMDVTENNGVDTAKFERIYCLYLDEIYAALPDIKLMLIAPYFYEKTASFYETDPEKCEKIRKGIAEKVEALRRISKKYNLPLIEPQPYLDEVIEKSAPITWAGDSAHPTVCGHEIIKRLWLETFEKIR